MNDPGIGLGMILGAVIVAVFTVIFFFLGGPARDREAVCHYLGGDMKADVCIVDGKVVTSDLLERKDK